MYINRFVVVFDLYNFIVILLRTKTTKGMTEEFQQNLSVFVASFNVDGPGAVGEDLDQGI